MKKYLIEFVGTFFLVLTIGLSANPLAIGAVLIAMVYMGGYISGAHYNPAITVAMWMRNKIQAPEAIRYIAVQLVAAIAAAATFATITNTTMVVAPGAGVTFTSALLCEIIFTFALVSVVLHTAASNKSKGNDYYGLAIGLTVMVGAFSVGSISGGAFNPAVGIGPALLDWGSLHSHLSNISLYLLGPLAGGMLAATLFGASVDDKLKA